MSYTPKVNDYVKWKDIEGWIYSIDEEEIYLTIEIAVKPKLDNHVKFHRKVHCLVCCYKMNWDELVFVKRRDSKYDEV